MRFIVRGCSACGTYKSPDMPAELHDDCVLEVTCPNGHRDFITVMAHRFELLFDFGVLALRDGYYREAVTSFNVALERCLEFFVRQIVRRKGADDAFKDAWKLVKNSSERQLGAFSFLFFLETKTPWNGLPEKMMKLRNHCVHNGYLPTRSEAVEFGAEVVKSISLAIRGLRIEENQEIDGRSTEISERIELAKKRAMACANSRNTGIEYATVVRLQWADDIKRMMARYQESLEAGCDWIGCYQVPS